MTLKTALFFSALIATTGGFAMNASTSSSSKPAGYMETAEMNLKEGVIHQVLNFPKGSAVLTSAQKRQLKSLAEANKGDLDSIHVAVWSDMPFPKKAKADLPDKQEDLADKRIAAIKKYLHDDLELEGIETYSMAEGSNWFSRAFNTEEGQLKSLFSQQGAPASVDSEDFSIVRKKGGVSKAVILIERESDQSVTR